MPGVSEPEPDVEEEEAPKQPAMKTMSKLGIAILRGTAALLFVHGWLAVGLGDQFLPVLETRTGVYSNVTVTLKTGRDIHIRHDGGIANVDLSELSDEVRQELGYQPKPDSDEAAEGGPMPMEWVKVLEQMRHGVEEGGSGNLQLPVELNYTVLGIVLLIGLLFHLFFSYCSRLICLKAGTEPGFLIWLPVLQIFPMFRAAGMSGWWFLGLLVPVLNWVVQILWCVKIVNARGKHVVWAILLILPLTNIVAFFYLAFSDNGGTGESVEFRRYSPTPV
jgi:hypothetical protein